MNEDELKEEFYQEMKRDAYDDARRESQEEHEIRTNYEYALDYCGLPDAIEALEGVVKSMNEYGHEISMKELLGEI